MTAILRLMSALFDRKVLLDEITFRLSVMEVCLKWHTSRGHNDNAKIAEDVVARFLAALCGWQLVNLNTIKPNYPAADLGDPGARIAVQVTVNGTTDKIHETHAGAIKHRLADDFHTLIILFLLEEAPSDPRKSKTFIRCDKPKIEKWARPQLNVRLAKLEPDDLRRVLAVLRDEMSAISGILQPALRPRNFPFPSIGELFIGREDFFADIRRGLDEARAAGRHDPNHVIWGLGGIGKTRAVLEYAWQHEEDYSALLFVSGETPEKLTEAIAVLTGVLGIACEDGAPTDTRCALALEWLRANKGWLLIIDNVEEPAAVAAVEARLASLSAGHVIITARLGAWKKGTIPLELRELTSEAAVRYLLADTAGKRAPAATPDKDRADAAALARDVDHLSLALETAAAYIRQQHISFAAYCAALAAQPASVLDFLDPATTHYTRSVARTWLITMDRLPDDAHQLLRVFSWFAPDPIPRSLLSFDPEAKAPCNERANLALLYILERYAFIHWDAASTCFTLHRLVQEIIRQQQSSPPPPPALVTALWWMDAVFVGDSHDTANWSILTPLLPHAHSSAGYGDNRAIPYPTAWLFNQVGIMYSAKAQYEAAELPMRRSVALFKRQTGPPHANYPATLNNLVQLLQATNRLAEAEPIMREALGLFELQFGPEHQHVATLVNNLAQLLVDTNRLAEAEPMMRRVLAIDKITLEPNDHRHALHLNNFANLLHNTNRVAEAEPLMRRALAIDESCRGENHPDVARDLSNLAQLLSNTRRQAEADPLMRRALQIDEHWFGANHPNVAIRLNCLAVLMQDTNRSSEAESLLRRALAIDLHASGKDHPKVAGSMNNLAALFMAIDRREEAEPLFRDALVILKEFQRNTGHPHPHLQDAINNYHLLLKEMGDTEAQAREKIAKILEPIRQQ